MNKLKQELNIARSKKINASRLSKMKERNECLLQIKEKLKYKLQQHMTENKEQYFKTVKDLILQGMIKLIEPSLQIKCRREDVDDIKYMLEDLQEDYHKFMKEKTGRDEY